MNKVSSCELSVVIPTYNEAENIQILLGRLSEVLRDIDYEVIVVDDDSPDLTWQLVELAQQTNSRFRIIRRIGSKGLSSAVITGLVAANGRCMAVMDSDLQHDEKILPDLLEQVQRGSDICVGSREAPGGSYGNWSATRKLVSFTAKGLAQQLIGTSVSDPMSGFFAISRNYFDSTIDRVNPTGFKILLEFVARGKTPNTTEVGYTFRTRLHGETKLNATVIVEYLLALIDLRFGWLIPNQFVKFGIVGLTGSMVNFMGFALILGLGASVPWAVIAGVELAIVWTYFANNKFTFTPFTFKGKDFFLGFGLYQIVCCYGLVVQLSVVSTLLQHFPSMGERLLSLYFIYLIGVAFAAVGNYFLHQYYTWNRLGFTVLKPQRTVIV